MFRAFDVKTLFFLASEICTGGLPEAKFERLRFNIYSF